MRAAPFICILLLIAFATFNKKARAEIIPAERRIDWTPGVHVGVLGGIINRATIGKNAVTDYGADPTGVADSRAAIQSTLDNTASGQVAYIPAGTYKLIGTVSIQFAHNKTLRGAGLGVTTLKFQGDGALGSFVMSGDSPVPSPTITVVSGSTKGSSNVYVNITTGMAANRLITISETNLTWIHYDSGLYGSGPTDDGHDKTRLLNSTHNITAISGTNVTFWPPLPFSYTNAPKITPWLARLGQFGIEDMTLDQTNSVATSALYISQAINCWMKGVEVRNAYRRQINWSKVINSEVRQCYFRNTRGPSGPNHEGIDLVQNCCFNLIEDNICIAGGKPAVMLGDWGGGCNGNVIGYNYFVASNVNGPAMEASISANHGPHSMMNLVEGNIGQSIKSDGYFGSTSHLISFRNYWSGDMVSDYDWRFAVQLAKWSYYCSFVGNVLGKAGIGQVYAQTNSNYGNTVNVIWQLGYPATGHVAYTGTYTDTPDVPGNTSTGEMDYAVTSSLIRHGNYDYVTSSTIWDAGIADHVLPDSYYLTAKPSWWGGGDPWPSVGSDLSPLVGTNPAKMRYDGLPPTPPPDPPSTERTGRRIMIIR